MYTYINPDYTEKIKKILTEKGDSIEYSKIIELCNSAFSLLPISFYNFKNEPFEFHQLQMGGTNVIYRAREIKNKDNKPFEYVSEINYISEDNKSVIKNFGRANKPEQSMFYGAFDYAVSCAECIVNSKELLAKGSTMFVVGTWKMREQMTLAQLPRSEKIFKEFYEFVNFDSETIQLADVQKLNEDIKAKITSDFDYKNLQFFTDQFARFDEGNSYKLSNYYCDRIFNNIKGLKVPLEIEGVIYPSIVNSYQKENIILKPSVVDKKLKFINAMIVWFIPAKDGKSGAQFIPIQQNITADKNGKLNWRL